MLVTLHNNLKKLPKHFLSLLEEQLMEFLLLPANRLAPSDHLLPAQSVKYNNFLLGSNIHQNDSKT